MWFIFFKKHIHFKVEKLRASKKKMCLLKSSNNIWHNWVRSKENQCGEQKR